MVKEFFTRVRKKRAVQNEFQEVGNQKLLEQMKNAPDVETVNEIRKARDELNGRKKRPAIDPNTVISSAAMIGGIGLIGWIEHNVGPLSAKGFSWLQMFKRGGKGS